MFKGLNGKDVDTSDVFLGNMFSDGLGVEKNIDKAIYYYSRCMTMGDDACAFDISTLFSNDPVKSYAYIRVAQKLQIASGTYNEDYSNVSPEINRLQQQLLRQQIMEGEKLADEICSMIPSCHVI